MFIFPGIILTRKQALEPIDDDLYSQDCGVIAPEEDLQRIVRIAVDCLRAQLVTPEEAAHLEREVEMAMSVDSRSIVTTDRSTKPSKRNTRFDPGSGRKEGDSGQKGDNDTVDQSQGTDRLED